MFLWWWNLFWKQSGSSFEVCLWSHRSKESLWSFWNVNLLPWSREERIIMHTLFEVCTLDSLWCLFSSLFSFSSLNFNLISSFLTCWVWEELKLCYFLGEWRLFYWFGHHEYYYDQNAMAFPEWCVQHP